MKSKIIFLNGTSSAGKSSIAKALQEKLTEPYLHIGIDTFLFMLASKYMMTNSHAHLGLQFLVSEDEEARPVISLKTGIYWDRIDAGAFPAIRALIDAGNNLIIDEVLFSRERFDKYMNILDDQDVFFIKVTAPLEVTEEREKARGDRVLGLARGLYNVVHSHPLEYDLHINTAKMSPEEAACQVSLGAAGKSSSGSSTTLK